MGYRKIDIEGTIYEYVVGRSHVKVRSASGLQRVVPKSEVGQPAGPGRWVVGPANIRNLVLGYVPAVIFRCEEHKHETRELAASPFWAEIHDKIFFMAACPECLHNSAMRI
ncbi:hypothetical protein [Rhizobium leguminosarum]|uniref:hypothetical protein n=1 Tax=Rhizobium leguminosarum TaxID=384 RepID=UPI002E0DA922|nr:hypothetical protein U8Q02_40530 [Rhizobium leguminosarum]